MGFHHHGAIAGLRGEAVNFIEQHRLADTAQSGEEDALLRTPFFHAPEENARLLKNSRATDEFGRWRACAG